MLQRRLGPSFPVLRVLSRLRGGSSSPVVVETSAGRFVAKLRGAAQGPAALVAEVIVAEIAEAIGLPVPERALLELEAPIHSEDGNDELANLLARSAGQNLGFRWLPDARLIEPAEAERLDDEFALRVLWLDGLVMNFDRTPQNPNILVAKRQPWLLDHGAALPFGHDFGRVTEDSPRELGLPEPHVFGARRERLARWDAELAPLVTRQVLERAVQRVPDGLFDARPPEWTTDRARAAYAAFLWKRLEPPRPFA